MAQPARLPCVTIERKSGFNRRTTQAVSQSIYQCLDPLRDREHTMTCNHEREFDDHETLSRTLEAGFYFAHPYAAWERGSKRNTNGPIRLYFRQNEFLLDVKPEHLQQVEDHLNHRPRKRLGWETPYEVFSKTQTRLAVALGS